MALEQLSLMIQEDVPSVELYTIAHRLLDNLSRLLSNLKLNIKRTKGNFKRSELVFFHDSKGLLFKHLKSTKYFNSHLEVDIPSGMMVGYNQAVTVLNLLYKQINIESTTKVLVDYFNKNELSDPHSIVTKIDHITIDDLKSKLDRIFSNKKTDTVPLMSVIESHDTLLKIDEEILKWEDLFKESNHLYKLFEDLDKAIDKHINKLEDNKEIDKEFITELHLLVKTAAIQFDSYGVVLHEMQRVEHNFVLVLNKLTKESIQ